MTVYGIGVDLTHIPHITRVFSRFGSRFLKWARLLCCPAALTTVLASGVLSISARSQNSRCVQPLHFVWCSLCCTVRQALRVQGAGRRDMEFLAAR